MIYHVLILQLLLLQGLSGTTKVMSASAATTTLPTSATYSYDTDSTIGPYNWKDLVLANNQCGGGNNSPIALVSAPCTKHANYTFTTGTCAYKDYSFVVNDHAEQANAPPTTTTTSTTCTPATMVIPGVSGIFELLQFHVHLNSEHTMNGNRYGAELHMVHKLRGGDRLAVVGVFIEATNYLNNDLFTTVLAEFDATNAATHAACNITIDKPWWSHSIPTTTTIQDGTTTLPIYELIPSGSTFYHYSGGLTTPPCSEIVEWNVADTPLSISVSQYNDLSNIILSYVSPKTCVEAASIASPSGSTSRPVQALNNRTIDRICPLRYHSSNNDNGYGASSSNSNNGGNGHRRRVRRS